MIVDPKFVCPGGDRRFLALWGFGCSIEGPGRACYGVFLVDGERCRIDREDLVAVAEHQDVPPEYRSEQEKALAEAAQYERDWLANRSVAS